VPVQEAVRVLTASLLGTEDGIGGAEAAAAAARAGSEGPAAVDQLVCLLDVLGADDDEDEEEEEWSAGAGASSP